MVSWVFFLFFYTHFKVGYASADDKERQKHFTQKEYKVKFST